MITYTNSAAAVTPDRLTGFFVGWPNPPSPETHLRLLHGSDHVVLAVDNATNRVVHFITALSDGVLSAYIPHLEVLPDYQEQGIGTQLARRPVAKLDRLYIIDLLCDPEVQSFYARLGMRPTPGMVIRNYDRQVRT